MCDLAHAAKTMVAHARMTVAEFLVRDPGDGRRWQLVDGEPQAMAPANILHGYLQADFSARLRNQLRASGMSCDVFANPGVVPATMSAHNMRIPDLAIRCSPLRCSRGGAYQPDAHRGNPRPLLRRLPGGSWPDQPSLVETTLAR